MIPSEISRLTGLGRIGAVHAHKILAMEFPFLVSLGLTNPQFFSLSGVNVDMLWLFGNSFESLPRSFACPDFIEDCRVFCSHAGKECRAWEESSPPGERSLTVAQPHVS